MPTNCLVFECFYQDSEQKKGGVKVKVKVKVRVKVKVKVKVKVRFNLEQSVKAQRGIEV